MPAAPILPYEDLAAHHSRWDLAFEIVLVALLAFMPFALGAVEAWSELAVVAVVALLALMLAARAAIDRNFQPIWTWAYLPLALMLVAATAQLLPLGQQWVRTASPSTAALRAELLGSDYAPAASLTISLYPLATARGLRMLLVAVALFVVVVNAFAAPVQIRRLLGWILIVGCAQAILALLQIFTLSDRIYWTLPGVGPATSGSFINYSNFSQFMNLSIGAGLALLLVRLHEQVHDGGDRGFTRAQLQRHAGLLAALAVCAISVLTSLSRNGAISMISAAALVGFALYLRGTLSRRGWLLAMAPLAVLAVLLVTAFDAVYLRLATLEQTEAFADRWGLSLGALRAWRQFPMWGTGLGTHAVVFPMFDTTGVAALAEHADNDYAQLLEETGLAGALALTLLAVAIGSQTLALCRRGKTAMSAAAFGLAFGLAAVMIHSATDFGQRLPAVFCLTATSCALIVRLAQWERFAAGPRPAGAPTYRRPPRPWLGALGCVALGPVWLWALSGAVSSFQAESWRGLALVLDDQVQRAAATGVDASVIDQIYGDLLTASEQAVADAPGNVDYAYWLNVYRWQALRRSVNLQDLQSDEAQQALPIVARIADELTMVRRLCPTYGPPYALEGQLRLALLGEARGRDLVHTGVRLAPYDPAACFAAGEIAAHDGRADEASVLFRRAVELQGTYFRDASAILLTTLRRPDLAEQLAAGDPDRLNALASLAAVDDQREALADRFRTAAEAALRTRAASGQADARHLAWLAAVEAREGRHEEAVQLYRRALASDYKQVGWHVALARSLAALGRSEEAVREAKISLRLRPNYADAQRIVDEFGAGGRPAK
ncbi:MAG: O-antigen ligase family protein [Pirellulales bacterium]|nr:O-antigen ligase family protein [Pirellulales bacterium]